MNAITLAIEARQQKLITATKSADAFHVPAMARNHAYILGKQADGLLGYNDANAVLQGEPDSKLMRAVFVVSTEDPDREGDVVLSKSPLPYLDNYKRANGPWFFGHQSYPIPIGKCRSPEGDFEFWCKDDHIEAAIWFAQVGIDPRLQPSGAQMFGLVEAKLICSTSIGFHPIRGERLKAGGGRRGEPGGPAGFLFHVIDVLEISLVGTPMNAGTELISVGLGKGVLFGDPISPMLRKAVTPWAVPMSGAVRGGLAKMGGGLPLLIQKGHTLGKSKMPILMPKSPAIQAVLTTPVLTVQKGTAYGRQAKTTRWNSFLDETFDVTEQEVEPYSMLIAWASAYLQVPVKKIYQTSETIPSVRMGDYLTALRELIAEKYSVEETRNLRGSSEAPPFYDVIKLNSKKSDTFLLEGTIFHKGQTHGLVVDMSPSWGGVKLTYYVPFDQQGEVKELIAKAHEQAKANNSLRGEKFSLSGEFLDGTNEDWSDLFLEPINYEPVARVVERINAKGKDFPNRGMILSGPPGTGKTLSGRILMNKAKATFIWVSARDFHYAGSFGGMTMAYDLAKELAPSIILFEDVDNWMGENSIDFLKTEMDGVSRYKGVLTVLTTNFPERIPAALIDRPGRFHDVLQFALPTATARKAMLAKWVPGISEFKLAAAVSDTDDYSGAHIYHLAEFAKSLGESEDIPVDDAVTMAIDKVREQRDLITGIQLEGSRYRPRKEMMAAVQKGIVMGKDVKSDYRPFGDGYRARDANRPITDNHCAMPDERKEWADGWRRRDAEIRAEQADENAGANSPPLVLTASETKAAVALNQSLVALARSMGVSLVATSVKKK
jgi:ATPase family associated with various cellular activities (AAA)